MKKKGLKKIISLLLVLTIVFAMCPNNFYALGDSGNTYSIGDMTNFNFNMSVNTNPYADGMRIEENDDVSFFLSWYLPSTGVFTTDDEFTYDFSTLSNIITLSDISTTTYYDQDGLACATYYVTNGVLHLQYTEAFLQKSNKYSEISLDGIVHITENEQTRNGTGHYELPGDVDVEFTWRTNTALSVDKTATKRIVEEVNGTHKACLDYEITIVGNTNNTNVRIKDYFGMVIGHNNRTYRITRPTATLNGEAFDLDIPSWNSGDRILTGANNLGNIFNFSGITINEGDELVIRYTVSLNEPTYEDDFNDYGQTRFDNKVEVQSDQCTPLSVFITSNLASSWIRKEYGSVSDGNITWIITVWRGEFRNLTIKDVPVSNINCAADTEVRVYLGPNNNSISGATLVDTITYGELLDGYVMEWPEGNNQYAILTFKSPIGDDVVFTNRAMIVEPNKSHIANYTVGNIQRTTATKTFLGAKFHDDRMSASADNHYTIDVLSKIVITIGDDAVSMGDDFYFFDKTGSSQNNDYHEFPSNPVVSITNLDTNENAIDLFEWQNLKGEPNVNYSGRRLQFKFRDGTPIKGTYEIIVKSQIIKLGGLGSSNAATSGNRVRWTTGVGTLSQDKAAGTYWDNRAYLGFLDKTVVGQSVEGDTNQILWKIAIPELTYKFGTGDGLELEDYPGYYTNLYESYKDYSTIEETIPTGLKFVRAYWSDGESAEQVGTEVNVSGGKKYVFKARSGKNLYVLTEYDGDYMALSATKTYTNKVSLILRTEEGGSSNATPGRFKNKTATGTIKPPTYLTKTMSSEFKTTDDGIYVEFEANINPYGYDLIPEEIEEQTFSAVDTMGSAFLYEPGPTITVNEEELSVMTINGTTDLASLGISLTPSDDGHGFTLYGLQDETKYNIKYIAKISLSAGDTLTADNATNKIALPDVEYPKEITIKIQKATTVPSAGPRFEGEFFEIRVYKHDDSEINLPVSGAEFELYNYGNGSTPASVGTYVETLTTNATGYTQTSRALQYGYIYGIKESSVPLGYVDPLNGDAIYFVYEAADNPITYPSYIKKATGFQTYYLSKENPKDNGDLSISKSVTGNASDENDEFTFEITLGADSINGTYGDVTFTNGVGTVSIKNGEKKTASGLPNGVTYTVTETDSKGYVSTLSDNKEGTITRDEEIIVTALNEKNTFGDLSISKTIKGNDTSADDEFSFTVTLSDTTISGTYGDMTFANGISNVSLKGGETKKATNLPNGITYSVVETDSKGYESSHSGNVEGTIIGNTEVKVSFTNEKNTYGDLEVSKEIKGNSASENDVFNFVVTLSDTTISGTFGDMTFTNGVANVALKGGESKKATGLPNGVTYSVVETEANQNDYVTTAENEQGTIAGNETKSVKFTNEKDLYGDLTVKKTIKGNDTSVDDEFSFTVTLSDTTVNGTFGDMTFNSGVANVTLKGGEEKTATNLPVGITYTVEETDSKDYTPNKTSDSGTISNEEVAISEFENERNTYGDLKVTKTVDGNAGDNDKLFSFTVTLSDTTVNGTYGDMTFNSGVAAFTLKHGETKTATDLPNGVTYTVVEADYSNDGYVTESVGTTGKVVGNEEKTSTFTNTKNTYGDLKVSKTVDGNACDKDKQFSFTVTLSDNTIAGTFGDMTFNSGVATFTLKDGETKTATDLPNGVQYTVTEADYSNDGYVTESVGTTGTIVGNEEKTSEFTNTRNAEGSLKVTKTLAGNDVDANKEFTFTVTLDDTTINETFSDVVFTNGVASIVLKGGEEKTISGLPNGLGYTVVETDYSNDGYTTKVTKGETTTETREATGTITEATVDVVAFTNERNTYGDLKVSKTVDGNACDKDKQFSFTVTLSDTTVNGTYGDMTFNSGVATFTLKDGETKTATALPNGVTYTVVEADYSNDGYVTESVGTTGKVVGNEEKTSEFTNTRNAEGSLKVTKTLAGNDVDANKEFTFTVTLDDTTINETFSDVTFTNGVGEVVLKGGQSKTISGLPNGLGYTVVETDYSNDGYTTKVTKGETTTETREATGTITEATVDVVAFTNERNTYGDLKVSKTVDGNAGDKDKQFNFTITLSDNAIAGTYGDMTFNSGVATFTLKHGETKTATALPNGVQYTVTEADYSNDGYVTESVGTTGTIVGNEEKTSEFTNTRNAEGSLTLQKVLQGNDVDTNKEFRFVVTLSDTTINGAYSGVTFTNGVAEVFLKGGQSKTIEGLPNGVGYDITEDDYTNDGYEVAEIIGNTGKISETTVALCKITNERNTYGDLVVKKTVDGNAGDNDKQFNFTVTLSDTTVTGTFGDMTFNAGISTFTLKHGEEKKAENLPNGVTYTVTEDDYTDDGYVTESVGATGMIVGDEEKTSEFTNTRNAEGSLTIKKSLTGNDYDSDKEFKFTITLSDTSINSIFSEVNFTNGVGNVFLKGGEEKTIEGLPNRMGYTVEEEDYSNEGYELIDTAGDITGNIDENEPKIAEFYNERNTYGNLVVRKTVTGKDGEKDKEFEFMVVLSEELTGTFGEMEFTDGIATFTLKDGEEIWAYDLPNGVEYEVIEADYTDDGYEVEEMTGETGTITDEEDSECEYVNFREVPNTGDELELNKWTFLTNLSGLALLILAFLKRKERKHN